VDYISVGRRAIAVIVDAIILLFVFILLVAITGDEGSVTTTDTSFEATGGGLATTLTVVVSFAYFIVLEKVLGATLGKLFVGIRVVMADGTELTWGASVIRNLLRVVDGFFFYLVGAIFVWNSPQRQRLGDQAAKTVVVAKHSVGRSPTMTSTASAPPPPPPPPIPPS
jgi:uncharacterized RDD family membrane protein YckC